MEFNFRDAKQYAGLTHCQARSEEKLHFHMNASLTSISIGKAIQLLVRDEDAERLPLSIADVKTECFNRLLLERIFSIYGIDPNIKKIDNTAWRGRRYENQDTEFWENRGLILNRTIEH